MRSHRRLTTALLALTLAPAVSLAQSIQSDFDRAFDFTQLKTFAFAEQARDPRDPLTANPLNDRRVRTALDSQLVARGYLRDTSGTPDFRVAYYASTRNRVNVQDWGYGFARLGSRRIDVNQVTEGTLMVDIVDPKSRELIWRGTASGTIELDDVEKRIRQASEKLIERFARDARPDR